MPSIARSRPRDSAALLEHAAGGAPVSPAVVRKSMTRAARDLDREFKADARARAQQARMEAASTDAFVRALVKQDPAFGRKAKAQKERWAALQRREARRRRRVRLPVAKVDPHVFTGSIGGVQAPAYHYDWNWFSSNGHVDSKTHTANRNTGALDMDTYLGGSRGAASIDLRTAVGFYIRPLTDTGLLRVDTSPAYALSLRTFSYLQSSSSSAWLGLYIGEYAVGSNTFLGAKVASQNSLGSVSTWWSGSTVTRSSSGYGMSSTVHVDSSHWYAVWVWAGIRGSVGGDGWLWNSGIRSSLDVTVPSFTWTLY